MLVYHFGAGHAEIAANTAPGEEHSFRRCPVRERVPTPAVTADFPGRIRCDVLQALILYLKPDLCCDNIVSGVATHGGRTIFLL